MRFSPFITLASGRPFNITTGKGANGDGLLNDRPAFAPSPGAAIIPRNYGSRPSLVAVNMRVGKTFILREPADKKSGDALQLVFLRKRQQYTESSELGNARLKPQPHCLDDLLR
jgi:hypothetical protein